MTELPKTITWHGKRLRLERDDGYHARYAAKGIELELSRDEDGGDWGVVVGMITTINGHVGSLNAGVDHYATLGVALSALDLLLKKGVPR